MTKEVTGEIAKEIRFNSKYAHLYQAKYPTDNYKHDSTPTIKKKTLFTSDYLKRLNEHSSLGIMPPNCRFIEQVQNGSIVIIEEPPAFRTILVDMSMRQEYDMLNKNGKWKMMGYTDEDINRPLPYKFTLAFPYMIFIFHISKFNEVLDGQVFVRIFRLFVESTSKQYF